MIAFTRRIHRAALFLLATLALISPTLAVETYINIPSIPGEDPTPGYPNAMAVSTLTITPQTLTVIRDLDGASDDLFLAAAQGTNLGTTSALLYNAAPAGPPDATLDFFNTLVSSYSFVDIDTEEVSFAAENPLELYLEVPGIPGVSNTPGHPSVIQIQSFSLTGNQFTIVKLQDSASDDLFLAAAQGDQFQIARLLLYDSIPLGPAPDAVIEFHDLLISSLQSIPHPVQPLEGVTFAFATLSQPIPEPATLALISIAVEIATCASRRRKS